MNLFGNADSSQALGSGIGNIFKAAAFGRMYGQQAEMNSALKGAMMQHHQASAQKALAEAEQGRAALAIQNDPTENAMLSLGLPTSLAPAFRQKISTGSFGGGYEVPADGVGPTMPSPASEDTVKKLAQTISLTQRMLATGSKVNQGSDAALDEQKMRTIEATIANPAIASIVGKAYAATSGKPLFNDVGNTGYSMDNFTGGQSEANPVLAKLFADKENSTANFNNSRAARVSSGLDKPVTLVDEDTGQATITAIPTKGEPRSIGVPAPKGTGADATNAKTRNAVIAAVEKEMPGADEAQITAEVTRRLERRGIKPSNKNPANEQTPPKIEVAPPIDQRKPNAVYQTPKGPMKWTGTGWLPA